MDVGRALKWIIILAVVYAIWKYGIPWIKNEANSMGRSSNLSSASGNSPCVSAAENASSTWGGGIGRYVNPPYDLNAWSSFKGNVDGKISNAESECSCSEESCRTARAAMSDLRGLVADLDSAIRGGASPGQDIVQRQEAIDNKINDARALVQSGK